MNVFEGIFSAKMSRCPQAVFHAKNLLKQKEGILTKRNGYVFVSELDLMNISDEIIYNDIVKVTSNRYVK